MRHTAHSQGKGGTAAVWARRVCIFRALCFASRSCRSFSAASFSFPRRTSAKVSSAQLSACADPTQISSSHQSPYHKHSHPDTFTHLRLPRLRRLRPILLLEISEIVVLIVVSLLSLPAAAERLLALLLGDLLRREKRGRKRGESGRRTLGAVLGVGFERELCVITGGGVRRSCKRGNRG